MRTPALPSPRRIAAGAGLALLAAGLSPIAASANPAGTGLVISEVYGAGGNSGALYNADFVELRNPTSAPIDLTGKYIAYRSASGTPGAAPFALAGSVPANGTWLVQMSTTGTTGAALPTPNQVAAPAFSMAAAGGQVLLQTSSTSLAVSGNVAGSTGTNAGLIDMVGASGSTTYETAAAGTATATSSLNRTAAGADTDNNSADFALAAPSPTAGVVSNGPAVSSVDDKSVTVDQAITPFTVTATGGTTPYTWSATGLPAGLTLDPATGQVAGTPTAIGTSNVTVTAKDAVNATASDTFTITVNGATGEVVRIAEVQGTGAASTMVGATLTTRGIVTAAYPAGGFFGFYIQTPGTGSANIDLATHTASDAIFVRQTTGTVTAAPGSYVEVTGKVAEFAGATQVEVVPAGITVVDETVAPVVTTTTASWPRAAAQKESLEGMRYRPTGAFTVTNTFSTNNFGEVGLAQGTKPLIQRTEVELPGPAASSPTEADNNARAVVLDDGASTNFLLSGTAAQCDPRPAGCLLNGHLTPPYISTTDPVLVGAPATFTADVIFTQGGSPSAPTYRFQPLATVVGPDNAGSPATFADIRTAAPDEALINEVGQADFKVASFNVLNYFTTLGDANNDNIGDGGCTPFRDRNDDGNTVNGGCDQRGAWDPQDFERQQSKIVDAINALDADVVGLMEIENSLTLGETADEATDSLVAALNADAGAGTWAANPSSTELPAGGMDVITNAIIYKPASVDRVGQSRALGTLSDPGEAFDNAREPLGQVFEADAGGDPFLFVVNHFKSKGSAGPNPGDADSGDGQSASNGSRVLQATALRDWVAGLRTETGVESVILGGDFNSYAKEDPLQVLYNAGYTNVEQEFDNGEYSYSFSGLSGSLDHILVNDAALDRSTGTDIWNINAGESLALEYSRWNYHATDFHQEGPYRSSDHDPVILGLLNEAPVVDTTKEIQILGINDFHGRILNEDGTNGTSPSNVAGAAVLSGAVKQLRGQNPNTVFAAAGDLIGASTFESFIQKDKPTIDALNEAGLEVSAVGNHELDAGYNDLVNRVMAPYDASTNPLGGAEWEYIAANLRKKSDNTHAVPDRWIKDFGSVEVGFVGAVTEDLPSLVSPDGIADIAVTDIVDEVNASADALEADGADVIVLLIHEGAANTTLAAATDPNSAFGQVVNGVDANIDAIVSGHTHLAYNHAVTVPQWVTEGRAVTTRPVVSAGQYGTFLNQLNLTVDTATGDVVAKSQNVLNLKGQTSPFAANYPADPAVTPIVNDAIAKSNVLGAVELGKIAAPFNRAKLANGTTENRGGESTLGNLVAEVQRWATQTPEAGAAQIAFMNPGGLRQDMVGNAGGYPATLTYKQAAVVQPFANTLVNMQLTGAQIKTALEQQWQTNPGGTPPSRPFLRLGTSEGFTYTYDPTRPEGDRITGMWLNGTAIATGTSYSVTVNSFLGSGGDNFRVFAQGAQKRDTGKIDLQAMVDYMDEFANTSEGDAPLAADYTQHSVGVALPDGSEFQVGDTVRINLSSLAFSTAADLKDAQVEAYVGGTSMGTFPVDNTIGTAVFDEYGTAAVSFTLPSSLGLGAQRVRIVGAQTGTEVWVPITVAKEASSVAATVTPAELRANTDTGTISVTVTGANPTGPVGAVLDGQVIGGAELVNGAATITIGPFASTGTKSIDVRYYGDDRNSASSTSVSVTVTPAPVVEKATPTITATADPATLKVKKDSSTVSVTVSRPGGTPTGTVLALVDNKVVGTGDLVSGKTSITVGPFDTVGTKTITLRYLGDDDTKAGIGTVSVTVQKSPPKGQSGP